MSPVITFDAFGYECSGHHVHAGAQHRLEARKRLYSAVSHCATNSSSRADRTEVQLRGVPLPPDVILV